VTRTGKTTSSDAVTYEKTKTELKTNRWLVTQKRQLKLKNKTA